jgi:hypothetical protein
MAAVWWDRIFSAADERLDWQRIASRYHAGTGDHIKSLW